MAHPQPLRAEGRGRPRGGARARGRPVGHLKSSHWQLFGEKVLRGGRHRGEGERGRLSDQRRGAGGEVLGRPGQSRGAGSGRLDSPRGQVHGTQSTDWGAGQGLGRCWGSRLGLGAPSEGERGGGRGAAGRRCLFLSPGCGPEPRRGRLAPWAAELGQNCPPTCCGQGREASRKGPDVGCSVSGR